MPGCPASQSAGENGKISQTQALFLTSFLFTNTFIPFHFISFHLILLCYFLPTTSVLTYWTYIKSTDIWLAIHALYIPPISPLIIFIYIAIVREKEPGNSEKKNCFKCIFVMLKNYDSYTYIHPVYFLFYREREIGRKKYIISNRIHFLYSPREISTIA